MDELENPLEISETVTLAPEAEVPEEIEENLRKKRAESDDDDDDLAE
jgi:hypothetical protein